MDLLTINHYLEVTGSAHISFQEGKPRSNKDQVISLSFVTPAYATVKFTFPITSLLASPPNTVTFFQCKPRVVGEGGGI